MNYHIPIRPPCHNHHQRSSKLAKTTPTKPAHIQHHQKTDSAAAHHHHHRASKPHQPHPRASKSLHQAPTTSKSPQPRSQSNTHRPWLSLKPRAMFHKLRSPTETSSTAYITPTRVEFTKKGSSMPTSSSTAPVITPVSPRKSNHQDLLDLLSCPVCLEEYQTEKQGGREPLFLACHHSVCRVCLPKLIKVQPGKTDRINSKDVGELSCPECRLVTLVPPSGLSQNFYLVSLIETGRKKTKGTSSRLRMWCSECDSVALQSCAGHHLTHLTAVLTSSLTTYTTTCARITTLLQVRARKNGEEVQEVKEALEQLDRAYTSLRRRLVAHLDHATLAQATASSLLHEVEEMNRQVEFDEKLTDQPVSPITSTSRSGRKVDRPKLYSSLSAGGILSSSGVGKAGEAGDVVASILKKSQSDIADIMYPRLDLLSLDYTSPLRVSSPSTRTVPKEPRTPSERTIWTPGSDLTPWTPPGSSIQMDSSSHLPQTAYDYLNCEDQEVRITLLKQCVASLEAMEASVMKDGGATCSSLAKDKSSGDALSKDALMSMFKKALEILDEE